LTVRPDHRGLANATQGIPTIRRSRATTHSGAHIRKDGDDDVRSGTRAPYDQAPDLARYRHSRIHRLEPAGNPPQSYVDNAVQANLLAAMVDDPAAVNQVYNVALNEKTTLNELFDLIRSLLAPRFPHVRGCARSMARRAPEMCAFRRPTSTRRNGYSVTSRRGGYGRGWSGRSNGMRRRSSPRIRSTSYCSSRESDSTDRSAIGLPRITDP